MTDKGQQMALSKREQVAQWIEEWARLHRCEVFREYMDSNEPHAAAGALDSAETLDELAERVREEEGPWDEWE